MCQCVSYPKELYKRTLNSTRKASLVNFHRSFSQVLDRGEERARDQTTTVEKEGVLKYMHKRRSKLLAWEDQVSGASVYLISKGCRAVCSVYYSQTVCFSVCLAIYLGF